MNTKFTKGTKQRGTRTQTWNAVDWRVDNAGRRACMRITEIHATQPQFPDAPRDWRSSLGQIVVEVQTDTGLTGLGVGGGGAASIHIVHTVLRDLLLGRDAREVEELHREMETHTMLYGRKGIVIMAISGVDLALWDLRGKATGKSVARCLAPDLDAGRRLSTYATVVDAAGAEVAATRGHRGIKLHAERLGERPEPSVVASLLRAVRGVIGDDRFLMLDGFARWDVETTLRIADAVGEFEVAWLEEPLRPDDFAGYEELARRCPLPIAGGEHEYTALGFRELVERGLHQILQPDINWCGGMTTVVEVYRMAKAKGLRVCPHRGAEAFALHAIAALDTDPLAESPRPWFRCLQGAPDIQAGTICVSDQPGFGVTLGEPR
jgi:L-rhamnonate dehydratase